MSFTMEDNLESGWVAVRPNAFEEKEKHKFVFIVAWNEVEGKFAITCHDRTVQRRRAAEAAAKGCSPKSKPAKGGLQLGRTLLLPGPPGGPPAVLGQLHPGALPPGVPGGTGRDVDGAVRPGRGPETEMDELCCRLQVYLGHALDTCGWKILSQVLFTENDDPDEYYESLSELRPSCLSCVLQLLEKHRSMDSMVELLELYEEEDQAYGGLLEASTQLYQYLLQPFRDMRELAMLRRQQIKVTVRTSLDRHPWNGKYLSAKILSD
uniref:Junction mediating and regulatory protein, p53 cofactor n=1 Tax=Salarias fasciatus TaxID=181472 RepID=A0A672HNJ7_SALFA